jgi:hypothetical protein
MQQQVFTDLPPLTEIEEIPLTVIQHAAPLSLLPPTFLPLCKTPPAIFQTSLITRRPHTTTAPNLSSHLPPPPIAIERCKGTVTDKDGLNLRFDNLQADLQADIQLCARLQFCQIDPYPSSKAVTKVGLLSNQQLGD